MSFPCVLTLATTVCYLAVLPEQLLPSRHLLGLFSRNRQVEQATWFQFDKTKYEIIQLRRSVCQSPSCQDDIKLLKRKNDKASKSKLRLLTTFDFLPSFRSTGCRSC